MFISWLEHFHKSGILEGKEDPITSPQSPWVVSCLVQIHRQRHQSKLNTTMTLSKTKPNTCNNPRTLLNLSNFPPVLLINPIEGAFYKRLLDSSRVCTKWHGPNVPREWVGFPWPTGDTTPSFKLQLIPTQAQEGVRLVNSHSNNAILQLLATDQFCWLHLQKEISVKIAFKLVTVRNASLLHSKSQIAFNKLQRRLSFRS